MLSLYVFSMAAGINYHTFSGFKQHRYIILQLQVRSLTVKSYWAETKVSARLPSFLKSLEENLFFLLLEAACIP